MVSSSPLKVQTLGVGQIENCCTTLRSFKASPLASSYTTTTTTSASTSSTISPVKTSSTTPKKSPSIRSLFSSPKKKKKGTPKSQPEKSPSKSTPSKHYMKKNSSTLTSATVPIGQDDEAEEVDKREEDGSSLESTEAIGLDLSDDSRSSSSTCSVKIDPTSDLAYHSQKEKDDCEFILQNRFTEEEIRSMPDRFMVVRHYRAEKGDITKAVSALNHTLKWRKDFRVHDIVHAFETNNELSKVIHHENETGKIYVRGYDVDGRACLYLRPGRENTKFESEYNNLAHMVFQLEKAVACSQKNGQGKICLIIDYEGFSMSQSPPMSTSKKTLDILQRHYCERMFRVYVCNPPLYFRTFWGIIKPLVDPVTKKKVCMCHGKAGMEQIVDDMGGPSKASKHLEKCAGGTGKIKDFNVDEYLSLPMNVCFDEQP
mmetsp:Transcript_57181/g.139397  ORF Transcript_57181/g.139397 Transcript_57181/m.139397 type:complete len:429 (+) Transcript_57181:250-1536(+)